MSRYNSKCYKCHNLSVGEEGGKDTGRVEGRRERHEKNSDRW